MTRNEMFDQMFPAPDPKARAAERTYRYASDLEDVAVLIYDATTPAEMEYARHRAARVLDDGRPCPVFQCRHCAEEAADAAEDNAGCYRSEP